VSSACPLAKLARQAGMEAEFNSLKFRIVFNDVFNLMQSRITMSKEKFDACISVIDIGFAVKIVAIRCFKNIRKCRAKVPLSAEANVKNI
jgi:hypothetical protein